MASPRFLLFFLLLLRYYCCPSWGLSGPGARRESSSNKDARRQKPIPYIATASNVEQERALKQFLRPGDRVLALLPEEEESQSIIQDAIGSTGQATFRHEFSQWRSALFCNDNNNIFNVLILDAPALLGNDLLLTTLATIQEFVDVMTLHQNRPRAVLVKSKTVASLARRLIAAPRLLDGTCTLLRPGDHRPSILAAVGVEDYRRTIPHVVQPGDCVLEVGCFSGTTTALLHREAASANNNNGYAIGVDIGPKIVARAQQEHPNISFAVGDGFQYLELLRIQQQFHPNNIHPLSGFNVVYADIGGLSGPHGLLESLSLLEGLEFGLEPRCIVIKSLCMRRLASSLRAFSDIRRDKNAGQQ